MNPREIQLLGEVHIDHPEWSMGNIVAEVQRRLGVEERCLCGHSKSSHYADWDTGAKCNECGKCPWFERAQHPQGVNEEMREALKSIAKNTCCDTCHEAALVARAALAKADVQSDLGPPQYCENCEFEMCRACHQCPACDPCEHFEDVQRQEETRGKD